MTKLLTTYGSSTYAQAKYEPKWGKAMTVEYESLMKNKTWNISPLTPGNNLLGCKWIYNFFCTIVRQIEKHKS